MPKSPVELTLHLLWPDNCFLIFLEMLIKNIKGWEVWAINLDKAYWFDEREPLVER